MNANGEVTDWGRILGGERGKGREDEGTERGEWERGREGEREWRTVGGRGGEDLKKLQRTQDGASQREREAEPGEGDGRVWVWVWHCALGLAS